MRSVVVLPEPDGPSIEKNSPFSTSRSRLSTARTAPNTLLTPRRRTAAVASACCDKRLLEPVEAGVQVLLRRADRNQDPQHVVVDARLQQQQAALQRPGDSRRRDVGRRLAGLLVLDQ